MGVNGVLEEKFKMEKKMTSGRLPLDAVTEMQITWR